MGSEVDLPPGCIRTVPHINRVGTPYNGRLKMSNVKYGNIGCVDRQIKGNPSKTRWYPWYPLYTPSPPIHTHILSVRVYTKTRWYPWYPLHLETWYPLVPVNVLQIYRDFIHKHVGTRGTHYTPPPPPTHTPSRRVYTKTRWYPWYPLRDLVPIGTRESTADIE